MAMNALNCRAPSVSASHRTMSAMLKPATSLRFNAPQHCRTRSPARLVIRAATQAPDKQELSKSDTEKKEKLVSQLKTTGLSQEAAKKILEKWNETGSKDGRHLRSMVRRRSLAAVVGISIQLALDVAIASGSFNLSSYLLASRDLPLNWLWAFGSAFVGSYYALGAGFDTFSLGATIVASLRFQSDSTAFVAAVREIGGAESGLNVIDKAAKARQTSKVFGALQNMSDMLKGEVGKDVGEGAGLSSLATYLLLTQAEKQGFNYEQEGLSSEEAGDIVRSFSQARLFHEYDTNDDDRLDMDEVASMARRFGADLEQQELREAFQLLDTDGSRYIEFPEFVKLYQKKLKQPTAEDAAA